MRPEPRILIIDDDDHFCAELEDRLSDLTPVCTWEGNALDGLNKAKSERFDVIILDASLPAMDGIAVRSRLKEDSLTARIPILFVTGKRLGSFAPPWELGTDVFLHKGDLDRYLIHHMKMLLGRGIPQPYPSRQRDIIVSLLCLPERPLVLRVGGAHFLVEIGERPLQLVPKNLPPVALHPLDKAWPLKASDIGRMLFTRLFVETDKFRETYAYAAAATRDPAGLRLRLVGPRDFLGVPFECLYEQAAPRDDPYLVLRHPVSRIIVGREVRRAPLGRPFLNELAVRGESLNVLLIGSAPDGDWAMVNAEIEAVEKQLKKQFERRGISVNVQPLDSRKASYEDVCETLVRSPAHIVHFAGHGEYRPERPGASHLLFFSRVDNALKPLTAEKLMEVLRPTDVRFLYLGCCHGPETASVELLGSSDLLGLTDAVVQAGVPSVLTFRSPPLDERAPDFAVTFYEKLAQEADLEVALFRTRMHFSGNRSDTRWISPILVMQS